MKTTELRASRIIGFFSLPSPALAEYNPEAYNNAMRDIPTGAGTCAHCGMGIIHHVAVELTNGEKAFVGTTCAEKVGCSPDQVRRRKTDEQLAADVERREQQRLAWENKQASDQERRVNYHAERLAMDKAICGPIVEMIGKEVLEIVARESWYGAAEVATQLLLGDLNNGGGYRINYVDVDRLADGAGKCFGRRNSKAYNDIEQRVQDAFSDDVIEQIKAIKAWIN